MADNFNLRSFLIENKLTKNAQLLKEARVEGFDENQKAFQVTFVNKYGGGDSIILNAETPEQAEEVFNDIFVNNPDFVQSIKSVEPYQIPAAKPQAEPQPGLEGVNYNSIELDGIDSDDYPDFVDAYVISAEFKDGTPLSEEELEQLTDELYQSGELADMAAQSLYENKKKPMMQETLTAKERRLVEMVQDALGITEEEHEFGTNALTGEPLPDPKSQMVAEDEMANETVIPEYKNIEELLKSIEEGTNKVAEEHKIQEMKKIADALRMKAKKMEESEHAAHISPKDLKQLATDAAKLEKAAEKLKSAFDKKFNKKEKAPAAPKAQKVEALQENKKSMENFNLKKFLTENKLTTNSRMLSEGFLDNVAASIKGKSEQGKLAQDILAKMGITKNPAEIFALGIEGGGSGPFLSEVQGYLLNGGDINTKIPFSKDLKSSAGGAIFKETYTFDFSKDIPTMKSGGKFIWNIQGGKWEPFGDKDGNENQVEPIDIESMKKESDAEPGTYVPQMSMMTIAAAAKIWPDSHPGTPYGYGKRLKEMVEFMEGKKITKMTPEDAKEFEGGGGKEEAPSA